MSENRDKELLDSAISLRAYVYAALEPAKKAKSRICVIGLTTVTIEEAKVLRDGLNIIVNSPTARADIGSGFIPQELLEKDYVWRKFKELLDQNQLKNRQV